MHRLACAVCVLGIVACGCTQFVVDAPNQDIRLAQRVDRVRVSNPDRYMPPAYVQQVQFGLVQGLVFLSDGSFSGRVVGPMDNAVIVTGYHLPEYLVNTMSLNILSSWRVRVYQNAY